MQILDTESGLAVAWVFGLHIGREAEITKAQRKLQRRKGKLTVLTVVMISWLSPCTNVSNIIPYCV